MKILHILSTNRFSGAENVVCQIASLFKNSSYEIIYASPDGPIRDALKERGVRFYPLSSLNRTEIKKAVKDLTPDIIHAHDMRASYVVGSTFPKLPIVSHIHNNGTDAHRINLKTIGFLYACRNIKHIFWVSKSSARDFFFRPLVKDKSSILPNIIDINALKLKASEEYPCETYDIVFLGRLAYPKNPMRFVELIKLVKAQIPDVTAVLIGDGNQRKETEELVLKYNLEHNISFLGYKKNPIIYLKNAKALVMTSFWEGTPMSSLEALALGIPVISTPVDGLKDIVENNFNGYLSQSNATLSAKLIQILEDEDFFIRLSQGASQTAITINNKERYRDSLIHIYNSIVKI